MSKVGMKGDKWSWKWVLAIRKLKNSDTSLLDLIKFVFTILSSLSF